MSIQIERVSVKNLGPLPEFDQPLKRVNLFYGHNETGKTYLVEFIYRSLFKYLNLSLRDTHANGKVIVSGLEKKETTFSPSERKKLEDFWEESLPGLPADFSRLLVVKGADLDLADQEQGIDDRILKEFLSGEGLLDKIGDKIKATEKKASYEDGLIKGTNTGKIREYNELRNKMAGIDEKIGQVDKQISGGRRAELAGRIKVLEEETKEQLHAKQNLAFTLDEEITALNTRLDALPQDQISAMDRKVRDHKQYQNQLAGKREELKENQRKSRHFVWLEKAVEQYGKLVLMEKARKLQSGLIWLVLTVALLVASIVLTLLEQPYFGVGAIVLAVVCGYLYLHMLNRMPASDVQKDEMEKIEEGYRERFGETGKVGEATLSARKEELRDFHSKADILSGDVDELKGKLVKLEGDIQHLLGKFPDLKEKTGNWEAAINQLQGQRDRFKKEFHEKDNTLSSLNIPKSEYREKPLNTSFDPDLYRSRSDELQEVKEALGEAENELQQLKQAVCGLTGESIDILWEQLIEKLHNRRAETVEKYKKVTAGLIARITVNQALDELREYEAARIDDGLLSDEVRQALLATTGHYQQVEKEGGELVLSDAFGRYHLNTLSTGAREQVLLGLRLGFAARLLTGKQLFLILDDAFQHSDWERRERLVKKLFSLAGEGWQVLYFTMDDHIRRLFEQSGKKLGKDHYQTIEVQGG